MNWLKDMIVTGKMLVIIVNIGCCFTQIVLDGKYIQKTVLKILFYLKLI